MKQIILFLLCLFPFVGKANPYTNIRSLKKGDWIRFELTGYYPVEGKDSLRNYWDDRNIFKMQVKATVMQVTDKALRMGFQYEYYSNSCEMKGRENGFCYSDTRFAKDLNSTDKKMGTKIGRAFDLPADIYPTEKEYDLKTGKVLDSKTIFENSRYYLPCRFISNGIQSDSSLVYTNMVLSIDIDELPQSVLATCIQQWNEGMLPLRIVHRAEGQCPAETRVVAASFALPHNVKLFVRNEQKPEINADTTFFCAFPQKCDFANTTWLVSPGDSIVLMPSAERVQSYSGRGAAENNFQEAIACEPNVLVPMLTKEITVKEGLEKWNSWYNALLQEYEPELSGFWKKSFQLTRNYYNAERLMYEYRENRQTKTGPASMIWDKEVFGILSPLTDYLFLPRHYGSFLTDFCAYKEAATITDNLSALRANSLTYYFAKQVLFGYPSYQARADILVSDMTNTSTLAEIAPEYNDFINNCRYPELVQQVLQQYDLCRKIEPGEKIQDAGFAWLKGIEFSNKKKDSYTLINIAPLGRDVSVNKNTIEVLNKSLDENGLSGKLNIVLYYPDSENQKETMSKAKNVTYRFLPSRELDKYLIYNHMPMLILVRNDGTILYRSLYLYPFSDPDIFRNMMILLKGDLQNPTAQVGFFYWKEMLLALFISGFIFFLWARFKQQKEKRKRMFVELEQKALRSQMNPHFIFNALSSIQSLILHRQTEKADRYLINFSKLLRMVLQSSKNELVSLSEEIEQIKLYVDIEQLRLPFDVEWNIDESIHTETIEIPGMLIQPLVENAIKHAIVPCGGGLLKIDMMQKEQMLYVTVTDNGNGIDEQKLNRATGLGIKNIRKRIKLYKEKYHINSTFTVENRSEIGGSGCKAELQIPIG